MKLHVRFSILFGIIFELFAHTPTLAAIAFQEREVSFSNGPVSITASLLLPEARSKIPAVVIIHGSNESDRSNPWTSAYATALASRGIAVLHPDKRGCGKSGGDWRTASLLDLADDAVAGVIFLGGLANIDSNRVGLAGFSQGGHILAAAAARSDRVAFAIDVSGSVVPMAEQISDEVEMSAERANLNKEQTRIITELNQKGLRFVAGGTDELWNDYEKALTTAKMGDLKESPVLAGFPARRDHPALSPLRLISQFDPMPFWKKVTAPCLFVFGGNDTQIRVRKSVELIQKELPSNQFNYTVLLFAKNGHALFRNDLNDFIAAWIFDKGQP